MAYKGSYVTPFNLGAGGGGASVIETTYAELKALRDEGKLVAGQFYRITDYHTTTAQEDTRSADHQFDIIVVALDASHLAEEAWAAEHPALSEEGYFSSANLNAWKVWYCLDNDTARFAWADTENGTGVIYRLIDEWNNDCPYDFKNIQFKRKIDLSNGYPVYDPDNGTDTWVYTFTATSQNVTTEEWSGIKDGSLESPYGHENDEYISTYWSNIIKAYILLFDSSDEDYTKCGKRYLNDIVFLGYFEEVGTGDPDNYPYYAAHCAHENTFGANCFSNTIGHSFFFNSFGNMCCLNTFGSNCQFNTFGDKYNSNYCEFALCYNKFGISVSGNTFGRNFSNNTFGDDCAANIFGDDCSYITFGDGCCYNTLANDSRQKHLEFTSGKTSGISGTTPEYWFNGEKKW